MELYDPVFRSSKDRKVNKALADPKFYGKTRNLISSF